MEMFKIFENNNDELKVHESEPETCRNAGQEPDTKRFPQSSSSKAQYSIVYLLLISGILLFFMGAIFLMSDSFQKSTTSEYSTYVLKSIIAKIEFGLMDLKALSSSAENASVFLDVPELIGEQRYLVTGDEHTVSIRTYGNPSLLETKNITFWNAILQGAVFSAKGRITLDYTPLNNTVTFK